MALQEGCYWSAAGCRLVPRQGPQAQGWRAVGGHAPAPVAVAVWVEASVRSPWNILCSTRGCAKKAQGRGEGGGRARSLGWTVAKDLAQLFPDCVAQCAGLHSSYVSFTWADAKSHFSAVLIDAGFTMQV